MKIIKKILIHVHNWNRDSWFLISIITSTASIWFSLILTFWGPQLNLVTVQNSNRSLTPIGMILTAIILLFSFILVAAQKYYEYEQNNDNKDKMRLEVLEIINKTTNEICDSKYVTLLKQIYNIKREFIKAPNIISDPKEQLKQIIKNSNESLCQILSYKDYRIKTDEMYVCIHYNFPLESKEWYLAESLYSERNISNKDLLDKNSTFKKILSSKEDLIFWNSKEEARKAEEYLADEEDQYDDKRNLKGSIACYKIQIIHQNQVYVNAIVSFATYSKKFVNKDDQKAINTVKYNIKQSILSIYKKRISIELCLLYILKLNEIQLQQAVDEKTG